MKKSLFLFAIIALFSLNVSAQIPEPEVKVSKVEGEIYRCLKKGGGMALKTTEPYRIWQVGFDADGKMTTEGLELEVKSFNVFRCPHCFSFEASLKVDKQTLNYKGNLNALGEEITLTLKVSEKGEEQSMSFPCTLAPRN